MPNYWLVGATWDGHDLYPDFVDRGYWEMGWDDQDQPDMTAKRVSIQIGDRIAIKKRLGQGATDIQIRAIGIVTAKSASHRVVFVDWIVTGMARNVECKGAFASIHGPYSLNDPTDGAWVQKVFSI